MNYFQKSGGPKIYLTLDESQGVLADKSGNDLNAYPYGCPTYGQDGIVDDSIRFGYQFPSCGSRFEVPQLAHDKPSPDFSNSGESFTLSAWVKLNLDTGNDQWIISQQNTSGLVNEAFQLKWTRTTQYIEQHLSCKLDPNRILDDYYGTAFFYKIVRYSVYSISPETE